MDANSFVYGFNVGRATAPAGGGAELNIAYGDTPPEDTSKLWCKTTQPSGVIVSENVEKQDAGTTAELTDIPMETPLTRYEYARGVVGTKVYFFGGGKTKSDGRYDHDTILRYDAEANTFETLSVTLPHASEGHGYCVAGTKIYLFGGYTHRERSSGTHTYRNTIQCFDTETETLTTLSATWPMTSSYGDGSPICSKVGSKIYLIANKKVHYFDTATETLTTLSTTFSGLNGIHRKCCDGVAVGEKIYLFGETSKNTIRCFDTATESLTTLSTVLPANITTSMEPYIAVASIGADVYVCMYYWASSKSNYPILHFDAETNAINTVVNLTSCRPSTLMVVGTKLYTVNSNDASFTTTEIVPKYDVFVSPDILQIIPAEGGFSFPIINGDNARVEINIDAVYKGNADGFGDPIETALHKDGEWQTI